MIPYTKEALRLALFTLAMFGLLPSREALAQQAAASEACIPGCRENYVCAPPGKCVSACNPTCDAGQTCRAGACVEVDSSASSGERDGPTIIGILGGPSLASSKGESGLGGEVALQLYASLGERARHGLVFGARGGAIAPFEGGEPAVIANLDLGYRGRFAAGRAHAGPLLLLSPGLWLPDRGSFAFLGATVGGYFEIGAFALQLPVSIAYLTDFSSRTALGIRASVLGGVAF